MTTYADMEQELKRKQDYVCNTCGKESRTYNDHTTCPKCGAKYWNKPPIEKNLLTLQDKYLETRSKQDFSEMLKLLIPLTRNLILNKLKKSGKFVSDEELEDMTFESILTITEYYSRSDTFKIDDSFSGYMGQVILGAMFPKKKQQREKNEISFEAPIKNSKNRSLTLGQVMAERYESYDFNEEYLMNLCEIDIQIFVISDYVRSAFIQVFKRYNSLKDALRVAYFLEAVLNPEYDNKSEIEAMYNAIHSETVKADVEDLKTYLYDIVKTHLINKELYITSLQHKEEKDKWEAKKKEEQKEKDAEDKPIKAKTAREVNQNIIKFGHSPFDDSLVKRVEELNEKSMGT